MVLNEVIDLSFPLDRNKDSRLMGLGFGGVVSPKFGICGEFDFNRVKFKINLNYYIILSNDYQ